MRGPVRLCVRSRTSISGDRAEPDKTSPALILRKSDRYRSHAGRKEWSTEQDTTARSRWSNKALDQSQDRTRRSIGMTRSGRTSRHQDTAFSWLVAFCGFLSNVIILGCSYSYGVLFPELLQEFRAGKATTGELCALFTLERIIPDS